MAWSPYPASSSAEASTAFGGAATPVPPGSATPTSGPAPAAPPSPGADVAADLRARLNLGATPPPASASGGAAAAGGAVRAAPPGLEERLREQLNLGEQRGTGEQQAAAPAAAPSQPTAGVARGTEAPPAGFCFVFGAAVPSPTAARAGPRRAKSPSASPAAPHGARPHTAASSRPSSASPSTGSAAASASASPRAAAWPTFGGAGAAPADSQATAAAGPAAAASGGFVFGAASESPAALRARHRARTASRSPQQEQQEQRGQQEQQRGAAWAAAMAAAMPSAPAAPEPLREQQTQQPPAGAQQQAAAGFVRLADFGKQAPASPGFSTAGGTARRAQRRKSTPTRGKAPATAAAAPAPVLLSPGAAPVLPATAPAAPGPASGPSLDVAQQAAYTKCEMYRSQGNEAFRDSDYPTAYDLYSKALQALWPHPPLHPRLALLLSNRAAALLSQGKPLSALADCRMGLKYDSALMRCALRVATCHSRMGDFDEAFAFVAKLREQAAGKEEQLKEIALKQKDLEEQERQMYYAMRSLGHALQAPQRDAATGAPLERSACGGNLSRAPSGSSLSRASSGPAPAVPSTAEAFWGALKKVDDIAPHVPHSELLLAAKAEGLVRLGKHRRAREFCEQPVHMDDGPHQEAQKRAPWRLWLQAQCSWHEGDTGGALKRQLEALLAALEAEAGQAGGSGAASSAGGAAGAAAAPSAFFPAVPAGTPAAGQSQEQRRRRELGELVGLPSAADVRQLLSSLETADKMRLAGNAAIKAGKAAEAVQKYTEALAAGGLSPAIASVLLSNRAAAHQHLKQRAQAVADCSRAVALNPSYAKAHSRLATLLAELGYHSDAASSLEAALATPGLPSADKRDYQQRLKGEKAAESRAISRASVFNGGSAPVDHYKLLGLERGAAAEEVRKAYKKLALQLHPDKSTSVCRVVTRCCGRGSPAFEAAQAQARLSERATWLFKLLGEANEVLSDPAKRRSLDASLARGGRTGFSSRYGDSDDDSDAFFATDPFFGGGFGGYGGTARGAGGFGTGAYGGFGSYGSGSYGGAGYGSYGAGTGFGGGGSSGGSAGARRAGGAGAGSRYWGYG
ncbi:isogeny subfamily C member 7 isoform A [Micractinium conductrix]|uniref:Isogeny subfamily C member 7 isoform A n=1 Tax=Micractinium conductrix TaxID=554055 RepID=A0A2P6VCY1_9CHLO|nr:isogeny subfamily C member 7 isoform A [Micractinium conductrix]|eukprot:PSC71960.1 isogeny subfamily C member 7 isoform A [Micractinium conductrix]